MPGSVAVVLRFSAQHETVQSARRANGVELLAPAGEQFVDVGLMADVEQKVILGGVEDVMQRKGELNNAQIRSQMPAGFGQNRDQLFTDFTCELLQLCQGKPLHIARRVDSIQNGGHRQIVSL